MSPDLNCLNVAELEALATERLDKQTRDYYNEGADSGLTYKRISQRTGNIVFDPEW
jgi:(S)-2-hydroxy-acid oxidase